MTTTFLTIPEAAERLRRSPRWLMEYLRKNPLDWNGIPFFVQMGRDKKFSEDDITRLMIAITGKSIWDIFADQLAGRDPLEPTPKPNRSGHVYFIEAGDFIKIGYTTSPVVRVIKMRTDCPWPIKILHHEPGTFKDEKALHRRFEAHRANGEWFIRDNELLEYIAARKSANIPGN